MPFYIEDFKVPVFKDINDIPVAPAQTKAGNGSDLINRYNRMLVRLQTYSEDVDYEIEKLHEELEQHQKISRWVVLDNNYQEASLADFQPQNKFYIETSEPIVLDFLNYSGPGRYVELFNPSNQSGIVFKNYGKISGLLEDDLTYVALKPHAKPLGLIRHPQGDWILFDNFAERFYFDFKPQT